MFVTSVLCQQQRMQWGALSSLLLPTFAGGDSPCPSTTSGFSSRVMFTRAFQDYFCLTEITLKLQFDLFILYPFQNVAIVLLLRGGVSALCQWACCKKPTLCVEAQGGFVNHLREMHFLFANTLVWVRPERIDGGFICERSWASQIPAIIGKKPMLYLANYLNLDSSAR